MNTAQTIKSVFEKNHVGYGFAPVSALIDAGFEYEVAHLINARTASDRQAVEDFIDNSLPADRMDELQVHVDPVARFIGKEVVDADNTYVVFSDGSALAANGWGQTFWHPVENFTPNNDYTFCDYD